MKRESYPDRVRLSTTASCAPGRRSKAGFTLLELVVTLAITSLILGLAVFSLTKLFRQQEFEKPVADLKRMARQAAGLASSRGRGHLIRLDSSGATLLREFSPDPIEEMRLPPGVQLTLQPWGGTRWLKPDDYLWGFDPSGLCEPIRVRFEQGESIFEVDFHPLGGGVRDERMVIANQAP